MIENKQELETTLKRIERFQKQVERLREVETNPRNYELSAGGFLAEINRMNLEVQHYLASNIFMYVNQLKRYIGNQRFNPRAAAEEPLTSSTPLTIGAQGFDAENVLLKSITDKVTAYDTLLDEDRIAEGIGGLINQFRTVEPTEKLAVTWWD